MHLNCVLQVSTHNMHSSSEDDDMESPFPNDLSLQQVGQTDITMETKWHLTPTMLVLVNTCQHPCPLATSVHNDITLKSFLCPPQAFSDYQIQQMTANFVDQFGFNDEEFSEHDENIK